MTAFFLRAEPNSALAFFSDLSPTSYFFLIVAVVAAAVLPNRGKMLGVAVCVGFAFLSPFQNFLLVLVATTVVFVKFGLIRVPEGRVALVERLGRYHKTLQSGLSIIIPVIDRVKTDLKLKISQESSERQSGGSDKSHLDLTDGRGFISTKEAILNPPAFEMIASDNAEVTVNSLLYFRIIDPRKAVYNVEELGKAMFALADTTLRQEVGHLNSDEVITARDRVGAKTQAALEIAAEPWGTRIIRVEIQSIEFAREIQDQLFAARATELSGRGAVIAAERNRDAEIAEAEGKKQSEILKAEGQFEKERLEAEGQFLKESRKKEGEAQGLKAVAEALRETPEALVALKALESQESVAQALGQSSNSMIIPTETAGLIGAIGSLTKVAEQLGWKKQRDQ